MDEKLLKYFKGDEFTASTWLKKYAVKDENGTPVETDPYQMFDRLAMIKCQKMKSSNCLKTLNI